MYVTPSVLRSLEVRSQRSVRAQTEMAVVSFSQNEDSLVRLQTGYRGNVVLLVTSCPRYFTDVTKSHHKSRSTSPSYAKYCKICHHQLEYINKNGNCARLINHTFIVRNYKIASVSFCFCDATFSV